MRSMCLLIAGALVASCTTAPPAPTRTAQGQEEYQRLTGGKVAGASVSCLPSYNANDMRIIDEDTIAFRTGGGDRVFVAHMSGCNGLRPGGPYALLTRQFGGSGLCRGDIAQVIDPLSKMTVGSCVFGDFTPYTTPGR